MAAATPTIPERTASFDLHLHSHWSYDALVSVEDLFRRAAETGILRIAVTEHHVLDSLPEIIEASRRHPAVGWIPSAELSMTTSIGAVDFLCYGLPDEPTPDLARALHAYHVWQQEAGVARQWGIQALGFDFTERHHRDLIESYRPPKTLMVQGYTHARNGTMREELIRRGIIRTEEEYAPLLRRAAEVVPFPPYPPAEQVLPAVRACGARVAIAHPFHYFQGTDIGRMDALRAEFGLDGIECAHRTVPAEMTPIYREYCLRHGLFSVGGSDAHTPDDLRNLFGHHLGEDSWLAADGPAAFPLHFRSGARLE